MRKILSWSQIWPFTKSEKCNQNEFEKWLTAFYSYNMQDLSNKTITKQENKSPGFLARLFFGGSKMDYCVGTRSQCRLSWERGTATAVAEYCKRHGLAKAEKKYKILKS